MGPIASLPHCLQPIPRVSPQAANLDQQIEKLKRQIGSLEAEMSACAALVEKSTLADARLSEHASKRHIDAKVGAKLRSKIRSADNPKAVLSFEDVVAQWDVGRRIQGLLDAEEFATLIGSTMAPAKALPRTDIDAAFEVLCMSLTAEGGTATDAATGGRGAPVRDAFVSGGLSNVEPMAGGGSASIPIRPALTALLAAEQAKVAADAALLAASTEGKAAARRGHEAVRQAVRTYNTSRQEEEAAVAAKKAASAPKTPEEYKAILATRRQAEAAAAAAAAAGEAAAPPAEERQSAGTSEDPLLAQLAVLDGNPYGTAAG